MIEQLLLFISTQTAFQNMDYPMPISPLKGISALQSHITELTNCINDNNQTYQRNLETLRDFYEQQLDDLHNDLNTRDEEVLRQKNQIITLKDLLQERGVQMKELKENIDNLKQTIRELQQNASKEREKTQQSYAHMDKMRQAMQVSLDKEAERCRAAEDSQAKTMLLLKEKENQINILKKQARLLEDKVAERYSMPEKMKEMQINASSDKVKIQNLQKNVQQLTQNRDYLATDLQRTKKELQKMTIQANKNKSDLSYQIEIAVKKEKERLNSQIEGLKIDNERKIYELKDLQMKLIDKSKICNELQSKLRDCNTTMENQGKELRDYKQDKQLYLSEFRNLKVEYELVIGNLENAVPQYQKKNWALEQQNQDLNNQLSTLSELLRELKAMNDMEPARGEYRKWAELSLAAQKKLPEQHPPKQAEPTYMKREHQSELNPDWDLLIADLERIQI